MVRQHQDTKSSILLSPFRSLRKGGYPLFLVLSLWGGVLCLAGAGWLIHKVWAFTIPDIQILRTHYPEVVQLGRQVHGRKTKQPFKVSWTPRRPHHWVPFSNISKFALGAVVVSEDWAFYSHRGYDLNQIREAVKHDLERGSFSRGASTITQQVVKNVFLSSEKTLWRKLKEFYLAVKLDRALSKRKILETYFNVVEWGVDTFGISAASARYFGKSPDLLTAREGAFLAMLLPSPLRYSQSFKQRQLTPYARKRIHDILEKMVRAGYLTPSEAEAARNERMAFETVESAEPEGSVSSKNENDSDEFDEEIDQDASGVDNQ